MGKVTHTGSSGRGCQAALCIHIQEVVSGKSCVIVLTAECQLPVDEACSVNC